MNEFILHHYQMSPFSQKMRSMLGYAGVAWSSAQTKPMPPRPVLAALAGGYRKVPVAQVGADVFCDTRVIAEEIAVLSGKPALALANTGVASQSWVARVDLEVFFAAIMAGGTPQLRRHVWETMSLADILRLGWDRLQMGRKATVKAPAPHKAGAVVRAHLADIEARLAADDFLFGSQPNHADFSAWHSLWFLNDLAGSHRARNFQRTQAWMGRMRGFGEGERREIDPQQALAIARAAAPRVVDDAHRRDAHIGTAVKIVPTDYGHEPVTGILVGVTPTRYILARDTMECGLLHVHFPQQGFEITPA